MYKYYIDQNLLNRYQKVYIVFLYMFPKIFLNNISENIALLLEF